MKETKTEEIVVTFLENKTYLKDMSVDEVLIHIDYG